MADQDKEKQAAVQTYEETARKGNYGVDTSGTGITFAPDLIPPDAHKQEDAKAVEHPESPHKLTEDQRAETGMVHEATTPPVGVADPSATSVASGTPPVTASTLPTDVARTSTTRTRAGK